MSHFVPWIALLILIGSVRSQEVLLQGEIDVNTPRFGFGIWEPIRHAFCVNFCDSTDDSVYIINLACAIKCPELYLPNGSTNPTSTTSSSSSMSPTSSSTPSSTTTTSTTQSGPSSSSSMSPTSSSTPSTTTTTSTTQSAPSSSSATPSTSMMMMMQSG